MKRREVLDFHLGRITTRGKALTAEKRVNDYSYSNGRVLSKHDKTFWDWLSNAIFDYEDRVKLPANRRGKL